MDKSETQRKMAEAYLQILKSERAKVEQSLQTLNNEIATCEAALSEDVAEKVE